MGNIVASTEEMDSEDPKRWFFENILFLDSPPVEGRGKANCCSEEREGANGPRVKRFTPSSAKLCNRNFLIHFTFNGKLKEYILKLQNQPYCRLLLCDRAGEPIKEIRTNRVKHMQRHGTTVEVFVRRDRQELSSFSFAFDSVTECDLFCEFVKMLFGIQVYQVGVTPIEHFVPATERVRHHEALGEDTSSSEEEYTHHSPMPSPRNKTQGKKRESAASQFHTGCPVHRTKPCRCNVERPVLSNSDGQDFLKYDVNEVEAVRSDKFPVVIEGVCEAGSILTMKDVAVRQLNKPPPRVVEWFCSKQPGKNFSFSCTPVKTGVSFRPREEDVGHYVQLRVLRRVSSTAADPFVYSLAIKGPVMVNSETAKGMLQFLSKNQVTLEALVDWRSLVDLFDISEAIDRARPFFECSVTLEREGLRFESKVKEVNQPLKRELRTFCFYVLRPASQDVDFREDNLELPMHIVNYNARTSRCAEKIVSLRMSSETVRDHLFHTLRLRRLSAKMPSFERWAQDLETGNFTSIKQYYSRTWEECTWEQYVDFKKAEQFYLSEHDAALPPQEAADVYGSYPQATVIPNPAAWHPAPGPNYGMAPSPAEAKAHPAVYAQQAVQGPSEATSAPAVVPATLSRGEAVPKATAQAPGSHQGGPSVANPRMQQHDVATIPGIKRATVPAFAAAPTPDLPVSAAVGGESAGSGSKPVIGRPPPGAVPAAGPAAKSPPVGAPPTKMAGQRVNNYALYAELYQGMTAAGQTQKAAAGVNTTRKAPQAKAQPRANAKAASPAVKGAAAQPKARD